MYPLPRSKANLARIGFGIGVNSATYRDHRPVSEGLDQLDLLVCEWLDSGAQQDNDADRDALAKQRNAKHRAEVADALMIDEGELVEV